MREACVRSHSLQLRKRISITGRRARQHHHAKPGGIGRRDAIVVRNKLQDHCATTVCKRCVYFAQQRFASRSVEVMQEVSQENQIVATAKVDIESAPFDRLEAVGDTNFLRILFRYFKHCLPIERGDFCLRIVSSEVDAVETMAGGDVEDLE